jgi:hypothetical protein
MRAKCESILALERQTHRARPRHKRKSPANALPDHALLLLPLSPSQMAKRTFLVAVLVAACLSTPLLVSARVDASSLPTRRVAQADLDPAILNFALNLGKQGSLSAHALGSSVNVRLLSPSFFWAVGMTHLLCPTSLLMSVLLLTEYLEANFYSCAAYGKPIDKVCDDISPEFPIRTVRSASLARQRPTHIPTCALILYLPSIACAGAVGWWC